MQTRAEHSYALSHLLKINYDEVNHPTMFFLIFSNVTVVLQAETQMDTEDWVVNIESE